MTSPDHATAVLALLAAAPPLDRPLVVCDGVVASGIRPPYVVVYFADADPEEAESRDLTMSTDRHVLRIYTHSVGATAAAAREVGKRVRQALRDVAPSVAGRQCWPIRREDGAPSRRDETTGSLVMDQVSVWRLESVPA